MTAATDRWRRIVRAELRRVSARPQALATARDACARDVLARATGTQPADWRLAHAEAGRPVALHPDHRDVSLSVTHAGDVIACAVSSVGPIGVDVEPIRPIEDVDAIRSEVFEPALNRRLDALPAQTRAIAFLESWVLFEALGKVSGRGIVGWRCPDATVTSDPDRLGDACGTADPIHVWQGARGALVWAVAVTTALGRPLLAWRWPSDGADGRQLTSRSHVHPGV